MIKKMTVLVLGFILSLNLTSTLHAQDDEAEFVAGIVSAISSSSISLIDSDSEEELEVTLGINADTIFENVESFSEITLDDEVYIDYEITSEGNVALNIFKMDIDLLDQYDEENIEDLNESEGNYNESEEEK